MKFKKFISLLAATAMTVTALTGAMTASASEVANGTCGDLTWTLDSDGVLTLSGEGAMASPEVKDLEPVEPQLGEYSNIYTYKEYKNDIKEVVIEEGATTIGFCAFYKMSSIETVTLPKTISEFKGVGVITTRGDWSDVPVVRDYANYAFAECTSLKNLTLTEGMTAIGNHAFYGCTSLETIRIPSTIEWSNTYAVKWGTSSFEGCSNLKDIILPEGLEVMGARVFSETGVESVVIPSTIEKYNQVYIDGINLNHNYNLAFANCTNLSSVTLTDGLKSILKSPFYNCPKLKRIAIPKSVTDMQFAFVGCTGIEEAYIEDGIQMQGTSGSETYGFQNVFTDCTNLKKLEIPEGVVLNYTNPQWCTGCSSLTDIYRHGMESDFPSSVVSNSVTIHCDYNSKIYKSASIKNNKEIISTDIKNALKELNTAVTEAQKYAEADYTAESYGALKTALENAEKYDENYTGVLPIEWAAEDINNVINSLVKKPSQDSVKPGAAKPSTTTPNVKSQAQKNAENAMKQAKITKLTVKSKAKKKITVTWKKVSKANGYQVQVSTNKKFKKNKIILTKTTSKKKITIKKLKSKKTYFVRVRAYATYKDSNGKPQKVYSSWIKKTRKVKVK